MHEGDWTTPPVFRQRSLTQKVLSVGASGVGLAMHNHGEAWESVVVGAKLWLFLPPRPWPTDAPLTDAASVAADQEQQAALLKLHQVSVRKLMRMSEMERRTLISAAGWDDGSAVLQSCLLLPGDAIFVPCNWYHATMNIGETVAVGGQRVTTPHGQPQDGTSWTGEMSQ